VPAAVKRSRAALTLVEVLVVTGLLATLSVMLYQIYVVALHSEVRSSASGGAYRQAFVTLEQIRRELRGARVTSPAPGQSLASVSFRSPSRQGVVAVDSAGRPAWEPSAELSLSPAGTVWCRRGPQERVLGQLGPQGSLAFRRVSPILLDITVQAYATDSRAEGRHDLACRVLLPNQE